MVWDVPPRIGRVTDLCFSLLYDLCHELAILLFQCGISLEFTFQTLKPFHGIASIIRYVWGLLEGEWHSIITIHNRDRLLHFSEEQEIILAHWFVSVTNRQVLLQAIQYIIRKYLLS